MGSWSSKAQPIKDELDYKVFPDSESLFQALIEIGPAAEKSENEALKNAYTELKSDCERKVKKDEELEKELNGLMENEAPLSDKYRDNVEQLKSDLQSSDPAVLEACFENVPNNLRLYILNLNELQKEHLQMQHMFGVLEAKLKKEFKSKVEAKLKDLDVGGLINLFRFCFPRLDVQRASLKKHHARYVLDYLVFQNSELMLEALADIGSAVEQSENRDLRNVYRDLRFDCKCKVAKDKDLEMKMKDLVENEVSLYEKYENDIEKLKFDLESSDPLILKRCFDNASPDLQRYILKISELEKEHLQMQQVFGELEAKLKRELKSKIEEKTKDMKLKDLSYLVESMYSGNGPFLNDDDRLEFELNQQLEKRALLRNS